jgi:hypothetical protein
MELWEAGNGFWLRNWLVALLPYFKTGAKGQYDICRDCAAHRTYE